MVLSFKLRPGLKKLFVWHCLLRVLLGGTVSQLFLKNHDETKNSAENKPILQDSKIYFGPS